MLILICSKGGVQGGKSRSERESDTAQRPVRRFGVFAASELTQPRRDLFREREIMNGLFLNMPGFLPG
jgi:hypothetical protein